MDNSLYDNCVREEIERVEKRSTDRDKASKTWEALTQAALARGLPTPKPFNLLEVAPKTN